MKKVQAFLVKPQNIYLILALSLGIFFIVIIPPFRNPDERNHYLRMYQLTNFELIGHKRSPTESGGEIPESIKDSSYFLFFSQYNPKYIGDELTRELQPENTEYETFQNTVLYSPVAYLPSIISTLVLKQFSLPPIVYLYVGRLFHLLASAFVVYAAISITPFFKRLFGFLALLAPNIALFTAISIEGMTYALSFLFLAMIFKAAFGRVNKIQAQEVCILAVVGLFLGLSKQSYPFLIFSFFLIPRRRFKNMRHYLLSILFFLTVALLPMLIWSLTVEHLWVQYRHDAFGIIPKEQLLYNFEHPHEFAGAVFRTIIQKGSYYLNSLAGIMGSGDVFLPRIVVILSLVGVAVFSLFSSQRRIIDIRLWQRFFMGGLFMVNVIFTLLLLHMSWNPVGSMEVIEGVYGRYFVPLIPVGAFAVYNLFAVPKKWKVVGDIGYAVIPIISAVSAYFAIVGRYYVE